MVVVMMMLVRSLTVNWERKNRHPFSYLLPVILTAVLLYVSLTLNIPRLLDVVAVLGRDCTQEEITLDEAAIGPMTILAGGRVLHYNPWQFTFAAGQPNRVTYTPRSRFIIEMTEIGQNGTQ